MCGSMVGKSLEIAGRFLEIVLKVNGKLNSVVNCLTLGRKTYVQCG